MMFFVWLIWWLLALEVWFSVVGWQGLTIGGRRWLPLSIALLVIVAALLLAVMDQVSWLTIALSALLGSIVFLAATIWRRGNLTMDQIYAPGERRGRRITELAIPLDGGPMPALLVEPVAGSTVGVLVVHGSGNHKTLYTWPLLFGLADAGVAVCAIDVDGHGDNPRVLDYPSVLENVHAGVAWLRERYDRVIVLGVSQGACIATRAIANGLAVDGLIVLEGPISIDHLNAAVIRREYRTLALPATWALHRDAGTLALVRGWRTKPIRTRIGTADLIRRLDIVDAIGRVRCPRLLIYGSSDAIVPIEQGRRVAAAAPDATFVIIPHATHISLSLDGRTIRAITTWLRAQYTQQIRSGVAPASEVADRV